jgi:large subunit ribosomal protein L29e
MVKQKNHTARNNTVKAHKNGIKKPKNHRYHTTRGVSLSIAFYSSHIDK